MKLILIAAVSIDGVIGIDDKIPWKITEDFKHYRETTMGNKLIVGYPTFITLPPKALEGREFIILNNRQHELYEDKFHQISSIDGILNHLENCDDLNNVFVIGGERIYNSFIDYCDEAVITWVNKTYPDGNKKFPITKIITNFTAINNPEWVLSKNGYEYKITKYLNDRKKETKIKTSNNY